MQAVVGGIAFVEVKATNGWHPHLHLLTAGYYFPHEELRRAWLRVTGDSSVVDIRAMKGPNEVVRYVVKYAGKPLSYAVTKAPERLKEAIETLAGRKLVFTFGSWRGWRIRDKEDKAKWIDVAPLHVVIERARDGDPVAQAILAAVNRGRSNEVMIEDECESDARGPPMRYEESEEAAAG